MVLKFGQTDIEGLSGGWLLGSIGGALPSCPLEWDVGPEEEWDRVDGLDRLVGVELTILKEKDLARDRLLGCPLE